MKPSGRTIPEDELNARVDGSWLSVMTLRQYRRDLIEAGIYSQSQWRRLRRYFKKAKRWVADGRLVP